MRLKKIVYSVLEIIFLPFFIVAFCVIIILKGKRNKGQQPKLVWGADPLINNKYWTECFTQRGYFSKTLMNSFYTSINKKEDYDIYIDELLPFKLPLNFTAYFAFLYAIYNFDIIHHPAHGFLLRFTMLLRKHEGFFIKMSGCKNIVLPYGSDIWMYSQIKDLKLRQAFLLSYPEAGKQERKIKKQVDYWINNASIFIPYHQTEGVGYWDVLNYNGIGIDEQKWERKNKTYSDKKNGIDEPVKVIHSPNHRGVKGTEFLLEAVEQLKEEGLKIELILLEKVSNDVVKEKMDEADILVEQLLLGHGMSAVEGMAKGLTVITNLENLAFNQVFRTYSFLGECPLVSASTENVTDVLRVLVKDPALRKQLGDAGRLYVEKYHSYAFSHFFFGELYRKIWYNEDVDLLNMFHPLNKKAYNFSLPVIQHPLINSKLPGLTY